MTDPLITNDEVLAVLIDRHADREELGSPARPCEKKVTPPSTLVSNPHNLRTRQQLTLLLTVLPALCFGVRVQRVHRRSSTCQAEQRSRWRGRRSQTL